MFHLEYLSCQKESILILRIIFNNLIFDSLYRDEMTKSYHESDTCRKWRSLDAGIMVHAFG